jgi:hypothetical protein
MFTLFGLKVNAWCFDVGLLLPRTGMVSSFPFRPKFETPVVPNHDAFQKQTQRSGS